MPYQGRGICLQNDHSVASPSKVLISPIGRYSRNLTHFQLPNLAIYGRPAHDGHEFSQRDLPGLTSLTIDRCDTMGSISLGKVFRSPLRGPLELDFFDYKRSSHGPMLFESDVVIPPQYWSLRMFNTLTDTTERSVYVRRSGQL